MKARVLAVNILYLLLYCGIALAQQQSPATLAAPFAGANISDFKGKVNIQISNRTLGPARGQTLPAETIISTEDGQLLLRLSDGSDVLVRSHTRLVLKMPETSGWRYLQLLIGRVRMRIEKHLGGTSPFELGTPSAVISVRGTKFEVEVDRRGITEVDVREGIVQLQSAHDIGAPVILTAGYSSRVGPDSPPETPRPTEDMRPQLERPRHFEKDNSDQNEVDESIREMEESEMRDRTQEEQQEQSAPEQQPEQPNGPDQ